MMIRLLAAAAVAALSVGAAHAGTLSNGSWGPSGCGADPGPAPEISTKSPESYNKSVKDAQDWQDKTKNYTQCVANEGKTDSGLIVDSVNKHINDFNTASQTIQKDSAEALAKVQKKAGKAPGQSAHNN